MNDKFFFVELQVDSEKYVDVLEKVVPVAYKGETYAGLISFMVQYEDTVGNAPLTESEREMGDKIQEWVQNPDPNHHVIIDVRGKHGIHNYRLDDMVGSNEDNFSVRSQADLTGSPVEYESLEMSVRQLGTGGKQ